MYTSLSMPRPLRLPHFLPRWMLGFALACMLALVGFAAQAAGPAANQVIKNSAAGTYVDATGTTQNLVSNTTEISVSQVFSLTLTSPNASNANPGGIVYYPHTLTNTGNGPEKFTLSAIGAATPFAMTSVEIYADNGAGAPTGLPITSTGTLAADAAFKFVVVGKVPSSATTGQTNAITVTATTTNVLAVPVQTASNIDTTTVTNNAIVAVTKAISAASGAAGSTPYKYTLTYINSGNSTATAVAISDAIPAGMTYIPGSARWSVTGVTPLSDTATPTASGTAPNTITSSYTPATKTLLVTMSQVLSGQTGTVTFDVSVDATTAPGVLNNTATTSYNDGVATVTGKSNTVAFTVVASASSTSLTFNGPIAVASAAAGQTVSFNNLLVNTGAGVDTFNITYSPGNFPAGTTFALFKSDGLTPLVDTNNDSIPDTGPVAAGANFTVVLKASLPLNATGTAFSATKTATSVLVPTVKAVATDTLNTVTSASVDLVSGTFGAGPGPELSSQVTQTVLPGASTLPFVLEAKNGGGVPDNYDLAASTVSTFGSIALPEGWTVVFKADGGAGTCATTGATITNTGSVPAGGSVKYCAIVTVPATGAGAAGGTVPLYFRVLSPNSGAKDVLNNAVTVASTRAVVLTPPESENQTFAGGSVVYVHKLVNNGNKTEGGGVASSSISLTAINSQPGWTSTLYVDSNNNGVLDATDVQITGNLDATLTSLGLAPGASVTILNKVQTSTGATPGAKDKSTITVTVTAGVNGTAPAPLIAVDTTTVVVGNVSLDKYQALDAVCAGTALPAAYSKAQISAKPGQCVLYQITATNKGTADATKVLIGDGPPDFTTFSSVPTVTKGTIAGAPTVGGKGLFSADIGTLSAGQSATISFGVKINQ